MKIENERPQQLKKTSAIKNIKHQPVGRHPMLTPSKINDGASEKVAVLMLTTFPPRECGIATYSQDLTKSLKNSFDESFTIKIGALHDTSHPLSNEQDFEYSLKTDSEDSYKDLANDINNDISIELVMIQHEFGLFNGCSETFISFLTAIKKPLIVAFHTVLPNPNATFLDHVAKIAKRANYITVMTQTSKNILVDQYAVDSNKVKVITHGTHLITHKNKKKLKLKYDLSGKMVLSTFGLLGPGKSIETTLDALPEIIATFPDVVFLILGKTHPTLVKNEGEAYRDFLIKKVKDLGIEDAVIFVNEFLPLNKLLEYLQLTDIYLFTSNDPNQAVSGTFSYAMSCGCPIISTPIPHAKEFLSENKGLLFDFGDSKVLTKHIMTLLKDKTYRKNLGLNGLHTSVATSWENSALEHGHLFQELGANIELKYHKPTIDLKHMEKMTTPIGIIQFSKLNQPDIASGYTLDDNARALIVVCEYYKITKDENLLPSLITYFRYIIKSQRSSGKFLNYVDEQKKFTEQNSEVNLEDSNGRAIWGLGHLLELETILPEEYLYIIERAKDCLDDFLPNADGFTSPRAFSFIIKGLTASGLVTPDSTYYYNCLNLGSRLLQMYKHESREDWKWFEPYLTYGNSILPEAMLEIYKVSGIEEYKLIAFESFNFLLDHLFEGSEFKVISNQTWFLRGDSLTDCSLGGQQPIDVAYTILALKKFHEVFSNEGYEEKMELAFSWFMGNNHLKQIIYNPCTKGCFDGLELKNVNLNQGAESTVSYLMARMAFEKSA